MKTAVMILTNTQQTLQLNTGLSCVESHVCLKICLLVNSFTTKKESSVPAAC